MKILEIAFTGYCVTDIARARAFYEGFLGLHVSRTWGKEPNPDWIEYDIGSGCLAIIKGDGKNWTPSAAGTCAALEVDDFPSYLQRAKEQKVAVVIEPTESPVCWMVVFADPDGNRIVLHKRK